MGVHARKGIEPHTYSRPLSPFGPFWVSIWDLSRWPSPYGPSGPLVPDGRPSPHPSGMPHLGVSGYPHLDPYFGPPFGTPFWAHFTLFAIPFSKYSSSVTSPERGVNPVIALSYLPPDGVPDRIPQSVPSVGLPLYTVYWALQTPHLGPYCIPSPYGIYRDPL